MSKFFEWLFTKGIPGAEFYSKPGDVAHAAAGGIGIGLFFIIMGLIFMLLAGTGPMQSRTKVKIVFARFVGASFIFCGLSRGVEVMALWDNFPHLILLMRDLTCAAAAAAAAMLVPVIKQSQQQRTLEEVHEKMQETVNKIEEVKEISKNLNSTNDYPTDSPIV